MSDEPRRYPQGVPSWIDLAPEDPEAAMTFYGELLGWEFEDAMPPEAPGNYWIARLDGQDVAAVARDEEPDRSGWHTYVAVDDADAMAEAVVQHGGRVVTEPVDAGPGGRWAGCIDPSGAPFRLWQARERLRAQSVNVPGTWNFSSLATGAPPAALVFYGALFGWEAVDLGPESTLLRLPGYGDHLEKTIDPDIRKRQGDIDAPPGFEDAVAWMTPLEGDQSAHWHVTIGVADRDEAAERATGLGATVVATHDSEWTKVATIQDPQGAVLTLSQFTPN